MATPSNELAYIAGSCDFGHIYNRSYLQLYYHHIMHICAVFIFNKYGIYMIVREKFSSIQILRAVAAISVVLTHAVTRMASQSPDSIEGSYFYLSGQQITVGDSGVDLFFVISGFIMLFIHRNDFGAAGASLRFLVKRILRIAPIYWIITSISTAVILVTPSLLTTKSSTVDLFWIAGSYLFLPVTAPSGKIEPIVGVGWTLTYEVFFYVVFASALTLPRRAGLLALYSTMILLVAAGALVEIQSPTYQFFTSWMFLDFLLGVSVAWLVTERPLPSPLTRRFLLLAGVLTISATVFFGPQGYGPLRILLWGIPSAMIVYGAFGPMSSPTLLTRILQKLGDASYSVYLVQVLALPFWGLVINRLPLSKMPFDVSVLVLAVMVVLSGVAFWWAVERPIGRWLARGDETVRLWSRMSRPALVRKAR